MDKTFHYPNAVVHVVITNDQPNKTIHKATEEFMRKVIRIKMEEFIQNGNNNTT